MVVHRPPVTWPEITYGICVGTSKSPNLLVFQAVGVNYSAGSTPFGEIAGSLTPAYNRPTLVDVSPSGFRVGHEG